MGKNKYIETPEKKSYVYIHLKNDNEPFYVGIGYKKKYKRAFETKGRNEIWYRILNKYPVTSKVIYDNLTWKEACEIEKTLISFFGRLDKKTGCLVNLTDGGEGAFGVIFSKERCEKISKALTGKKLSKERVEQCKLRRQTKETKAKISLVKTGLKASEETKAKMSASNMRDKNPSVEKISKPLIDINTGVFYNSISDASRVYGISKGYMNGMIIGRYKNKTSLRYA